MKITSRGDMPSTQITGEGFKNIWRQDFFSRGGSPVFAYFVYTIGPGGHMPYHTHPREHINYIISGEGSVVDGQGSKRVLKAGDCVLTYSGEKHQYRNDSKNEPFVLITINAKPGDYPDQVFHSPE